MEDKILPLSPGMTSVEIRTRSRTMMEYVLSPRDAGDERGGEGKVIRGSKPAGAAKRSPGFRRMGALRVLRSASLVLGASILLLSACSEQKTGTAEQRQALERAVYQYLFGAKAGDTNRLARSEVDRFASGSVFVRTLPRFMSTDYEQHVRIIKAVFSFVDIGIVDCSTGTATCSPAEQTVALSLQDDVNGSLNELANELAFRAGELHLGSDPFRENEPIFRRHLGNTCVGGFAYGAPSFEKQLLNGMIINIEPVGATRLQCTAEKALFLLGLYPTPDIVSAASQIVEKVSMGSNADVSILPDGAERALGVLYSNRVRDMLRAQEVPEVIEEIE